MMKAIGSSVVISGSFVLVVLNMEAGGRAHIRKRIEALRETKGDTAPAWNTARKADFAALAEREIAKTGWLPVLLRKAA